MATRHALPVLLLLASAVLLAPSASATPFVHGDCEGGVIGGEFTGYCTVAWPCICPNPCQHWYVHGTYVFQLC